MKFLNDPGFHSLKNILDARMKELSSQGIRVSRHKAEIITEDDEEKMWQMGVLGDDTPQACVARGCRGRDQPWPRR